MHKITCLGINGVLSVLLTVIPVSVRFAAAADPAVDVWANAAKYEFGSERSSLYIIEEEIRTAPVSKYAQYEDKLLALFTNKSSTYAAKDFVCRMLRVVGSKKCVPVLAEFITDEKMAGMVRYALQGLPFSSVDDALRGALEKASGSVKAGIISSIAARADSKAVPLLQPLVADADAAVASAAISALGCIGTADALKVLSKAKVADSLKPAVMESRLMCADAMLGKGENAKALEVYKELVMENNPKAVRMAAVMGLVLADKDNVSIARVIEMLRSTDTGLQRAAGKAMMNVKGDKAAKAILSELGSFSPEAQIIGINVIVASGYKAAGPEIVKMTGNSNDAVKIAAIQALGELGDESNVEFLSGLVKAGGDVGKAAVTGLSRLKGAGVSAAIMKTLANVDAGSKAILIGSLAERQSPAIIPDLIKYADDPDESVRTETMKSLGGLAGEKEIPLLIGLMLKTSPGRVQAAAEQAVQAACARVKGEDKRVEPLVAAMKNAKLEERAVILHCLGRLGGEKALEIVRKSIKDSDEKVQEAAVRALVDWTDDGATADLLELAKNAPRENLKILAFRGYVRLVSVPAKGKKKKDAGKTASVLADAMSLAVRPDEKRLVLGALGGISDLAALEAAEKFIKDESLQAEAELACIKIAGSFKPGKVRDKAMAVVKTIAGTSKSEAVRKQAEAVINRK